MAKIVKLITENVGKVRPDSLEDYVNAGGYEALKKKHLKMTPEEIIEEVKNQIKGGRGGAVILPVQNGKHASLK